MNFNFFSIFILISSLEKLFLSNSSNFLTNSFKFFSSTNIPEFSSTSSGVAQSLYPKTGTPNAKASAVQIPKLSFVRFISHLAYFIISILS